MYDAQDCESGRNDWEEEDGVELEIEWVNVEFEHEGHLKTRSILTNLAITGCRTIQK